MTLKAVNLHSRIHMAAYAKICLGGGHTVGFEAGMTGHTTLQAVFGSADPAVDSVVALVLQKLPVLAPHDAWWLYAFFAPGLLDDWAFGSNVGPQWSMQRHSHEESDGTKSSPDKPRLTKLTLLPQAHLNVPSRAHIAAYVATDALVVIGIDVPTSG